jgi:type 1 glutamine amidotransferase
MKGLLSRFGVLPVVLCIALCGMSFASQDKIKVLVVTGGHPFEREAFFNLFEGYDDITYKEAVQPKANEMIESGEADKYDVLVLYDMWQPITEGQKKAFVEMLKKGKGLVVLHHCLASYQEWPEFFKIIGGKFYLQKRVEEGVEYPQSRAAEGQNMEIKVNKDHPIMYGMEDFVILDETYDDFRVAQDVNVFLTTDNPDNGPKVAWTKTYGKSRVVYFQLGHDNHAYSNPNYRRIIANSIRWAAAPKGLVPLFNGKDLSGWEKVGNAKWTVQDGVLVGQQSEDGGVGELLTEKSYSDFILFVDFEVAWPANSGVWFRYQAPDKAYQADILEWKNPVCWTGTLYCPGKMFLAMNEDPKLVNKEGWNTFIIYAQGDHVVIFLNDKKVADVHDTTTDSGKIGFQVHPGDEFKKMKILVRSIAIHEL